MFNWLRRVFTKSSKGEKLYRKLFPFSTSTLFSPWSSNRAELVGHFRTWNYVGISAICEAIAGLTPQVAYRRKPGSESLETRDKLMHKAYKSYKSHDPRLQLELDGINRRYVPPWHRIKAITTLQRGDELEVVEPDHRLVRLLENPNPMDVSWQFEYKDQLYLETNGCSYTWIINGNDGLPAQLWNLPSHWVRAIPGEDTIIGGYEIRPIAGMVASDYGAGWWPGAGGMLRLEADEVIATLLPSPTNPFDGHSPTLAIAEWIDCSENADRSRIAQFQNSAFPGMVLEVDKEVADPTEEEAERIIAKFKKKYTSVVKTGEPLLLSPGIKMVPVTKTPVEMDYVNSSEQMMKWILAARRVGPSIAGLTEATSYANAIAARANFHQSTIKPKLALKGQIRTQRLAKRFHEDLVVYWPDPSLSDPQQQLSENTAYLDRGVKTPNEVRQELGLPKYPHGGDDPIINPALTPIPWATGDSLEDITLPASMMAQQAQGQPGLNGKPETNGHVPVNRLNGDELRPETGLNGLAKPNGKPLI